MEILKGDSLLRESNRQKNMGPDIKRHHTRGKNMGPDSKCHHAPPVDRMTHRYKNITFPQLRLQVVKIEEQTDRDTKWGAPQSRVGSLTARIFKFTESLRKVQ